MKLKSLTVLGLLSTFANGATNTTLQNVNTSDPDPANWLSYPIVDNTGTPIAAASSSVQFGSFTDDFASTLSGLDTDFDAEVIAAFTPSSPSSVAFSFDGLFDGGLGTDDGGALGRATEDNGAYALVTYDPGGGAQVEALVISFGQVYPEQVGNVADLSLGKIVEIGDVVFGGKEYVTADTSGLPGPLQPFNQGIPLNNVIPEPSTGLLSLIAGLGLLARRRR